MLHIGFGLLRRPAVILLGLFVLTGTSPATASWFSEGDQVVVVRDTPVMDQSRQVTTLSPGTNFRVHSVHGSHVSVAQRIDGQITSGWVKQSDVLKIDRNHLAVYATCDDLVRGQGQFVKLPRGLPVHVRFESDHAVDVFIVTEEGLESYKWVADKGTGQMSARHRELRTRSTTMAWTPSDENQYYVLIDNTSFPDGGANSGRTIYYSMAFCVEDPKPAGPRSGRGLLVGRATLDFDNYEGRHGRHREAYKVVVDVLDGDGKVVDTLQAAVDGEGYFFLENVDTNRRYQVKKLDGAKFDAPVTVSVRFRFATNGDGDDDNANLMVLDGGIQMTPRPSGTATVLDMGHIALLVDQEGSIRTRIDAPGCSVENNGGSVRFGGSGENAPLDRHEWFLEKFRGNGWVEQVKADRDAIYKQREDARRKQEEEKRKKEEEEERKQREAEAKKQEEAKQQETDDKPDKEA